MRRLTIKIKRIFLYSRHTSKKNLFDSFVFFLQDVIELILWFCVGYFFGHVFFYVFIKAKKKNPRKDITDFFEKYKQKMAEKPSLVDEFQSLKLDEAEKPSSVEEKERAHPGKVGSKRKW